MIKEIFNLIFYQPLFNFLILIYELVPGKNFGLAIIFLTILIKILLYPLYLKSIQSQKAFSKIEPQLKEIRERFKDDKEKMAQETFKIYQKTKINPFSGFFLFLIQLPILLALYKVFSKGIFNEGFNYLYSFVPNPGKINPFFLIFDLSKPNFILAFLAGTFQFFEAKISGQKTKFKKEPSQFSEIFQKQMLYFFPFFTFFILLKIPSAIALYFIVSTVFSIFQFKIRK